MVEIDKAVIELHKKYIGTGLYEHPKLNIRIGDGAEFIKKTNKIFDVIIADTTDEDSAVSASFALFTSDFFENSFKKLSDDGIFIIQSDGWGRDYRYVSKNTLLKLKRIFKKTYLCLACIPSMYPGFMTFIAASKKYDPRIPLRKPDFKTKYYSPDIHRAAFVLPLEIKNFLLTNKNN
jgi:spermidine synthase